MKQLHWTVYVTCAAVGTASVGLLITSASKRDPALGHWGLLLALLACVVACSVICDRFARRIDVALHEEAERRAQENEALVRSLADKVIASCNNETRCIANEVSRAVLSAVNDDEPTPIRR